MCTKTDFTIVLDLDDTLIKSWEYPYWLDDYNIYNDINLYKYFYPQNKNSLAYSIYCESDVKSKKIKLWGIERPYLRDFLQFCQLYFKNIIVWSAGKEFYVYDISKQIFYNNNLNPPALIWTRNECSYDTKKKIYHKPLNKLSSEIDIDIKKIFIIDDKKITFQDNEDNGILIPEWAPGKKRKEEIPLISDLKDRSDQALKELQKWFMNDEVILSQDIRLLNKKNIFTF